MVALGTLLPCTSSRFLAGDVPHRLKPHPQGLRRPFQNRPCSRRGSVPTLSTLQVAGIRFPSLAAGTLRTAEAFAPPKALQIGQASRLRRKPIVAFLQRPGIVHAANRMRSGCVKPPGILHLWLVQASGYPILFYYRLSLGSPSVGPPRLPLALAKVELSSRGALTTVVLLGRPRWNRQTPPAAGGVTGGLERLWESES